MPEPIRLLIVDDSRLFRSALEEALAHAPEVKVVGSFFSAEKAMEFIKTKPVDLVTLDVEMPGMDGLETLRQIQALNSSRPGVPPVSALMVSAFTRRGAQVTVDALSVGAFDFVAKPSASTPEQAIATLRDELLAKIRTFATSRGRFGSGVPLTSRNSVAPTAPATADTSSPTRARLVGARAIVIGASTGGPRALVELLPELCRLSELPILIVQHMPANFTKSLAESLARMAGRNVVEASAGMRVENRRAYVAPGGKHLTLRGTSSEPFTEVNEQPPVQGCRPSADVLFRSAAALFGSEVVAVILTGMGRDGTAGLGAIRRAGGYVVAQDEATSVVWGMPGSAVEAGVTNEVLPLNRIAQAVFAASRPAVSK